jgi:alkane 1-monooxygenase
MHPLQFLAFLVFTAIAFYGVLQPFPALLFSVAFVFVAIPLIDFFLGTDKSNPTAEEEKIWKQPKVWAPALYLYSLTHFALLAVGGWMALDASWPQALGIAFVVGLYTGGIGITVGHELCHKKEFLPRLTADLLLSSVWYQHFAVEHVRGHHLHVSTPEDPASARQGEHIYAFLIRSITCSFRHALKLDAAKVWIGVAMAMAFTALASFFGAKVLGFFLFQAVVAFVLLEFVNYIEHYGLSRKPLGNGRYEKVTPIHSWNSAHKFSNLLLFNLQRHSDHHAMANLPYTVLKHHESAPQLPSGYPGMIMLSLVPPLWFKHMDPKVEAWKRQTSTSM